MTNHDRPCERCAAPFERVQWNHRYCTTRCREIAQAQRTIARCQAKLADLAAPAAPARWHLHDPTPEQAAQVEAFEDRIATEVRLAAHEGVSIGAMLTGLRRIAECLIETSVGKQAVRPWFAAVLADLPPDPGEEAAQ
jgi:hypothetical protein